MCMECHLWFNHTEAKIRWFPFWSWHFQIYAIFKKKICIFYIKFHWILFLRVTYKSALIEIMTWCWKTGSKSLSEAMMSHFINGAYVRHFLNTLRPRQDGRHFTDDIFTCIFFNENCCILIKFSLKYVRKGPIDNNPALVQIMAWRRSGDKPLSEPLNRWCLVHQHICASLGLK